MAQLKVIVNRLNKRSSIPANFSDKNIVSVVTKGYLFEGSEAKENSTSSLGKWYVDRDGYYYWAGGLLEFSTPLGISVNIKNLPSNLPFPYRAGIDISHHNNLPDWQAIKNAGISFVFIKLSEGVGTPDAKAGENAIRAKQQNLKIGYYHFCRPDTRNGRTVIDDATAEANEALKLMSAITKPDLPLVLDLEDQKSWDTPLDGKQYWTWINTFIKTIKDNSGSNCIIYSRKNYLDEHLHANHDLGRIKLWISRYSIKDFREVKSPVGWTDWAMWQYCEDGVIGGNAKLDINILKDQSLF